MSTMPTTVNRVRRALAAETALALLVAVVFGFVLGFASQAFGAEEADPGLVLAEAAASLDEGLITMTARSQQAREAMDEGMTRCIGERLLVMRAGQRALRNAEDDYALARLRGDQRAASLALERGARAREGAEMLLAEAKACASADAVLGRGDGVTVLRVLGPPSPEDLGFGPPSAAARPLGLR